MGSAPRRALPGIHRCPCGQCDEAPTGVAFDFAFHDVVQVCAFRGEHRLHLQLAASEMLVTHDTREFLLGGDANLLQKFPRRHVKVIFFRGILLASRRSVRPVLRGLGRSRLRGWRRQSDRLGSPKARWIAHFTPTPILQETFVSVTLRAQQASARHSRNRICMHINDMQSG
jgi:hypothetical protein